MKLPSANSSHGSALHPILWLSLPSGRPLSAHSRWSLAGSGRRARLWVPPGPQVAEQEDHSDQGPQWQGEEPPPLTREEGEGRERTRRKGGKETSRQFVIIFLGGGGQSILF